MKKKSLLNQLSMIAAWIALLVFGALGITPLIPPALPETVDSADFNAALALDHIQQISQKPRPIGSPANQRVRAYIVSQLELLGLEPEVQTFQAPGYYRGAPASVEIGNVVVLIPGTAPTGAVALIGHYDTVPEYPGANDDGSAVAILLEMARLIQAGPGLRNNVILIFIDAEEPAPRYGSSTFVAEHPWASEIGFVINLEAVGSGGPSTVIGLSGPEKRIIDLYVEAARYPTIYSFMTTTSDLVGGSNSDFATFKEAGYSGLEFAYLHGSPIYHTAADNPENVSQSSLQQQGTNTLDLTRAIGNTDLELSTAGGNEVFFSVGRSSVIRYPAFLSLPLALAAGAVLIAAGFRQRDWPRVLKSALRTVGAMMLSALAAVGVWTVVAGQRPLLGVAESYLYLVVLAALTAGIGIVLARLTGRRIAQPPDATGVLIVWWALGLLTAIVAPGMSYLFVWPALLGGLTLLGRTFLREEPWWGALLAVPAVGSALVVLLPAVDTFYQFSQPRPGNLDSQMLFMVAIPILLLALLVELGLVMWTHPEEATASL